MVKLLCNPPFKPDEYYLLDGGLSTQLSRYIPNLDTDPLWTGRALVDHKEELLRAHRDFLKEGARILLTASYQVNTTNLKEHLGLGEEEVGELLKASVDIAWEAVKQEGGVPGYVLVGGSVGPYGACLHDGSEYTGSYIPSISFEELRDWHTFRVKKLAMSGASFMAVETMPHSKEALAVLDCILEIPGLAAWVTFSVNPSGLVTGGEEVGDAVRAVLSHKLHYEGRLLGVGVNCCTPGIVTEALSSMREVSKTIPLIAYPNSGEEWVAGVGWKGEGSKEEGMLDKMVREWVKLGAVVIGGCCRVEAEQLHNLRLHMIEGICKA